MKSYWGSDRRGDEWNEETDVNVEDIKDIVSLAKQNKNMVEH